MTLSVAGHQPEACTIEGAAFYPRPMQDGMKHYIRQSNIPDSIRKHALEHWFGSQEREGILSRLREWTHANSEGDGVIPAGELLALITEIEAGKLYGYQRRDKKADFGTNAHDWLKARLTGEKLPVTLPGVAEAVAPAEAWIAEHEVKALSVESVVFDERANVAGRIDIAASVGGIVSICDWKTGSVADKKTGELYQEIKLQNHLYRRGWSSMHGNGSRSRGGWILKLPANETERFAAYQVPWDQNIMDAYDSLVAAWVALRKAQGKFAGGYR